MLGATSFKSEWVSDFKNFNVVIVPDGDEGGVSFSKKITGMFNSKGLAVNKMSLPNGKDASDVLAQLGKDIEHT